MHNAVNLDLIWTAGGIARFLNCSTKRVHQMRGLPGCPIRQMKAGGCLYASRSKLMAWVDDQTWEQTGTNG